MNTFGMRMAAVFMFVTSTIGLRTAVLARWVSFVGFAFGLVLLLVITDFAWIALVFPLWVLLVSTYILCSDFLKEAQPECQAAVARGRADREEIDRAQTERSILGSGTACEKFEDHRWKHQRHPTRSELDLVLECHLLADLRCLLLEHREDRQLVRLREPPTPAFASPTWRGKGLFHRRRTPHSRTPDCRPSTPGGRSRRGSHTSTYCACCGRSRSPPRHSR